MRVIFRWRVVDGSATVFYIFLSHGKVIGLLFTTLPHIDGPAARYIGYAVRLICRRRSLVGVNNPGLCNLAIAFGREFRFLRSTTDPLQRINSCKRPTSLGPSPAAFLTLTCVLWAWRRARIPLISVRSRSFFSALADPSSQQS